MMDYFFLNWFSAELKDADGQNTFAEKKGPDVTKQMVLAMLNCYQNRLEQEFLTLTLQHKVLAFKEPGQKEPSLTLHDEYCHIRFSSEMPTWVSLESRIKKQYPGYKIETWSASKDGIWVVNGISDTKRHTIHVKQTNNVPVLHPETFEQVYPVISEKQGNVLPALDKYLTPTNLTVITPEQMVAFLKNCKIY